MSQYLICRNSMHHHGQARPMPAHGPARIRHVIKHRDCFPAAGILESDTPRQAKIKAIAYWTRVDQALNDWKAAGALDRFWADLETGGRP